MLPHVPHPTTVLTTVALLCAAVLEAQTGPTVSVVAGEVRHGEAGRQDGAGIEATLPVGPLTLYADAMGRHGDDDDDNSGMPWLTVTAGSPTLTIAGLHLSLAAGLYSTPMSGYGTWEPLAGPRLDIVTGSRWSLVWSHYWRRRGLVRQRMTRWTARTLFALQLRLLGGD